MNNDFESNLLKRISFVLTTKNRASYLRKALENISQLLGPDDELIIIDGNSTDGTQEIIKRNLDFIDVYVSEDDEGQAHAFNKGLLLSKGKYICYITDDDIFYQKAVEQAVKIMENNCDIDVLIPGGMKEKNGKEWYVYMPKGSEFGKTVRSLYTNNWCGLGIFIRTISISKTGLSDPHCVALDNSFIAQCISRGLNVRFGRINMYYHRIYEHSGTILMKKAWEKDYYKICKQNCSHSFYLNFRWNIWRRKYKWLPHFDLIGLPYRSIKVLLTEGPISFLRKAKKRIFEQDGSNKILNKPPKVVWDGTTN